MKVITGGLLIDGTGRDPVSNAGVVVDDEGRIAEVGKLDMLPRSADIVDVSGRTIMPGLIDCHVHFFVELKPMHDAAMEPPSLRVVKAAENAKATLEAGVTTVRDTGGTPLGFKMAAERGLIPAPRMRISITVLSQTGGHADFLLPSGLMDPLLPRGEGLEWSNGVCDGVDEVRKTARAVFQAGADFLKLCSTGGVMSPTDEPESTQFTRDEISTMVYEARAQGKRCAAHAHGKDGILNAIETGVWSIEHGTYLDDEVASAIKSRGTFLVPTLQAPHAGLRKAKEKPGSVLPQSVRKAEEVIGVRQESIQLAIESGVKIAMGTDAGVGDHGANTEELRLMVEAGMTPMQSIVASTKTASECLEMDPDVGTLEPGKLADLLVVAGNPLDDIGILEDKSKLSMIVQGGAAYKDKLTSN